MSVKWRQELERKIAKRVIADALKMGFTIDVNDGEEITVKASADRKAILSAMMTTDEDYLILHRGKEHGWVRFVYGNDGWDVVNDYSTNIDHVMAGANAMADKWG